MRRGFWMTPLAALALLAISGAAYAETAFDMSGMIRLRPEMRENADFNSDNDDKQSFIGSRTRLTVKAAVTDDAFAKITIQDVRSWGDANNVSTGKEQQALDLYEAFFQVNGVAGTPISVSAGRQPLVYGDHRLLGHLGWKDEGRTHDVLKVMLGFDRLSLDLFAAKEAESGKPSDDKNDDDLNGAYAMIKLTDGIDLDVYALQWKTAGTDADGNPIKGHNVMTYGARIAGKMAALDFTGEYAIQSGDWAEGVSQEASAFAVTAGYTLPFWSTRIGAEYVYGSGDDDSSDDTQKNFVFPFHTNHGLYGFMDYFSWGNMTDTAVRLKTTPMERLTLKLDYHIFTLAEGKGDWLNVVGTGVFKKAVPGKDSTDAGQEIDLTGVYKAMDNLKLVGGLSQFTPGDAAKERSGGAGDASKWGYLMAIFTF